MLQIGTRELGPVVVAVLSGRLTLGTGDRALHSWVDNRLASGHRKLALDLSKVDFIDSSGLGELVGSLRAAKGMGGWLKILNPAGRVYDTLSLARLLPLFEVFTSEEDLVASFASAAAATEGAGELEREVLYQVQGHVALLTLNRPRRFNALTREMLSVAVTALAEATRDRTVRALVVTGAGRFFCFGADAEELLEGEGSLPTLELFQTVIRDIALLPKPVLAAVNGFATGAGLDLALACDLRVMSERAKLASAFVRLGLVPDGGSTHTLPRLVGPGRAADLLFSGRAVDADEALRIGLVNRVVPASEVLESTLAWAKELTLGPARAMGRAKMLLRANPVDLGAALAAEATEQGHCFGDPEFKEGLHAHLEKRAPSFPE